MARLKVKNLKETELNYFIDYLQNANRHHTVGVGNGPNRPRLVDLFVIPFNVDLPTGVLAKASATVLGQEALGNAVNTHASVTLADGQEAIGLRDYSAARVSICTGRLTKGRQVSSHRTSRHYNSYYAQGGGTKTLSFPFGKGTAVGPTVFTELQIFGTIRDAFKVNGAIPEGTKITLIKEKFSKRT